MTAPLAISNCANHEGQTHLKVAAVGDEQVVELDEQHKEEGQTHLKVAAVVCG